MAGYLLVKLSKNGQEHRIARNNFDIKISGKSHIFMRQNKNKTL